MMVFLGFVGLIVSTLAVVALACIAFFQCMDGDPRIGSAAGVGAILLMAGVFTLAARGDETALRQCLNAGRAWAITGSHIELRFNAATKTSMPTEVTDYGCVDRR